MQILLLDDEPALVELMQRYLVRHGYQVDTCNSARQAWQLIAGEGRSYDLIVVDLLLPDERGDKLLERILARDATIRGILCSGAPGGEHLLASGRVRLLSKPFLPKDLLEMVRI
jgi:two-component system phosphate regulon response regulator OmpR